MPLASPILSIMRAACAHQRQAADHNLLTHAFWLAARRYQWQIWLERVESKLNLSDLPSRESYELLAKLGATRVPAAMPAFS